MNIRCCSAEQLLRVRRVDQARFAGHQLEIVVAPVDRLDVGASFAGPAIVEQFDATTAIPPGWRAAVDGFRNLILSKPEA